jgi:hypothetical protein
MLRRWLESVLPDRPARDDVACVATELGSNAIRHTAHQAVSASTSTAIGALTRKIARQPARSTRHRRRSGPRPRQRR